jgi:hypothetical protein
MARQYEDMNDGPALLNEFLIQMSGPKQKKQLNEPTNGK